MFNKSAVPCFKRVAAHGIWDYYGKGQVMMVRRLKLPPKRARAGRWGSFLALLLVVVVFVWVSSDLPRLSVTSGTRTAVPSPAASVAGGRARWVWDGGPVWLTPSSDFYAASYGGEGLVVRARGDVWVAYKVADGRSGQRLLHKGMGLLIGYSPRRSLLISDLSRVDILLSNQPLVLKSGGNKRVFYTSSIEPDSVLAALA